MPIWLLNLILMLQYYHLERFGLVSSVWWLFFGFVNVDDLKRPLVSLKVVKSSLELNLGTNLGWVGWFGLGCVQ